MDYHSEQINANWTPFAGNFEKSGVGLLWSLHINDVRMTVIRETQRPIKSCFSMLFGLTHVALNTNAQFINAVFSLSLLPIFSKLNVNRTQLGTFSLNKYPQVKNFSLIMSSSYYKIYCISLYTLSTFLNRLNIKRDNSNNQTTVSIGLIFPSFH